MSQIQPMIDAVEATDFPYVAMFISDEGVHLRPQTKEACEVMAEILNEGAGEMSPLFGQVSEVKVIEREEFLRGLREIQATEEDTPCPA